MFTFLLTIVWILSLVKNEITNQTDHSVLKIEELEFEEKLDSTLVTNPYFSKFYSQPQVSSMPKNCSNVQPPDSAFTCEEIHQVGLCDEIPRQFCKSSCYKNCSNFEPMCKTIISNGLYDYFIAKGYYCQQQCKNTCSNLTEARALMQLKISIQYPDQLSSWTGDDPCNGWDGVICKSGHVSELRLGADYFDFKTKKWVQEKKILDQVFTSIPAEFSYLKNLNALYLGENGFTGKLPPELSALNQLNAFNVEINNITGYLPPEFSTWTNIFVVAVDFNKFFGQIPEQFSTWRSIDQFWVYFNQLSGSIPKQFSTWSGIEVFYGCGGLASGLCTPSSLKNFSTGCRLC